MNQSTLVQVMAWCRHYLSQCWPRSMSPNGVTRPQWVKSISFNFMVSTQYNLTRVHQSFLLHCRRINGSEWTHGPCQMGNPQGQARGWRGPCSLLHERMCGRREGLKNGKCWKNICNVFKLNFSRENFPLFYLLCFLCIPLLNEVVGGL